MRSRIEAVARSVKKRGPPGTACGGQITGPVRSLRSMGMASKIYQLHDHKLLINIYLWFTINQFHIKFVKINNISILTPVLLWRAHRRACLVQSTTLVPSVFLYLTALLYIYLPARWEGACQYSHRAHHAVWFTNCSPEYGHLASNGTASSNGTVPLNWQ